MNHELIRMYLSEEQIADLREVFAQTDSAGTSDVDYAAFHRYVNARHFAAPWLERAVSLAKTRVLDYGCGTGSATSALAASGADVMGVDIDARSLRLAESRASIMGVSERAIHYLLDPHAGYAGLASSHDLDVVIFFATLGHMEFDNRIFSLRQIWEKLPSGGVLAIMDTPNRFCLWDYHASRTAFFHLEPLRLQRYLLGKSPRSGLNTLDPVHDTELAFALQRWGAGISHNDIQFALGDDIFDTLVLDGLEREATDWYPPVYEDALLYSFYRQRLTDVPVGFSRHNLNIAFKKGHSGGIEYAQDSDRLRAYENRLSFCADKFKYDYFLPNAMSTLTRNQ